MKAFRFRLERVLSWRGTQLSLAEAKVEQLMRGLRSTNEDMASVAARRTAAQDTVARSAVVSGADLRALESSRLWAVREEKKLAARVIELQQSIKVQDRCVLEARRGVKLVTQLKVRKYQDWKVEAAREIDELAAESAIAQWRRLNH